VLAEGFADIIIPIYEMTKFMKVYFNLGITSTFAITTSVPDFQKLLTTKHYPNGIILSAK
jgi:hypothetical protein